MAYDKAIYKKLSHIVAPIALQYLMASLVTASDAFMLGFLDQDSLSASSLAGQIAFVFSRCQSFSERPMKCCPTA